MKNIVTFVRYWENIHMTQWRITSVKPSKEVIDNTCGKIKVLLDDIGAWECERCKRGDCIINK